MKTTVLVTERFFVIVVFTGQGYFVLMINPTGSTTFGQGACALSSGFRLRLKRKTQN